MKKLALLYLSITLLLLSGCYNSGLNAYHLGNTAFYEGKYKESYHYYLCAARHRIAAAQYALGYQYYYGYGVESNMFKSMYWFEKAAPSSRRARFAIQKMHEHQEPQPWMVGLHWH